MKPRVRVWYGVCEIDGLVLLFEVVLELQLEGFPFEPVPAYPFHPADLIAPILAPLPALLHLIGLQPTSIQILLLTEVADIQLDFPSYSPIVDLEVVPAGVSSCVGVTAEEEVKLVLLDADGHVEVAALEGGIELDPSGFGLDLIPLPVLSHSFNGLPHYTQ